MRRNDLDIRADILRTAMEGARKTHIVYKANLNFKIVKKYLANLIGEKLLEIGEDDRFYFTTGRGKSWLSRYEDLRFVTPDFTSPVVFD